ncbi:DUF4233 domain-containing protein [Candidatus Nanopelagicus hibericus]|jgi:hypothetical protein|uniref:DUF4233 domain-containing protein n=1 Tax=Candidatus Nanopelagicus hibericus TaxID=1884915 RepID=A0A249K9V6_9ACTN|nr:DUF4233 domain-containing protein [Candidatus Nanopelagicus hibericus]ASY13580.1 DUF4233 domain-containing protein [Candidatus Nanopelagicus hibericus]
MRVMAAAVLTMESLLMGFALLIAKDSASNAQLWSGAGLAIALLLSAGLLKRKGGYLLGSILQIFMISYGLVIWHMYYMGGLFALLWITAIALGRRGEAIKASLIEKQQGDPQKRP